MNWLWRPKNRTPRAQHGYQPGKGAGDGRACSRLTPNRTINSAVRSFPRLETVAPQAGRTRGMHTWGRCIRPRCDVHGVDVHIHYSAVCRRRIVERQSLSTGALLGDVDRQVAAVDAVSIKCVDRGVGGL